MTTSVWTDHKTKLSEVIIAHLPIENLT